MTDAQHNQMTGAEAMVRLLEAHGVRHIFGLCGDTTLPFYDAMARLDQATPSQGAANGCPQHPVGPRRSR